MANMSAVAILAAVVAAVVCIGPARPVAAQAPSGSAPAAPDAGWRERDYLLHYATTVCVQGAYGRLTPAPTAVLDALAQEAWAMVEMTRQAPETYAHIHDMAMAQGKGEAPERALAGCRAWAVRNAAAILKLSTAGK